MIVPLTHHSQQRMETQTGVIFGSVIALALVALYCYAKAQLTYNILDTVNILGLSLFILNFPLFIQGLIYSSKPSQHGPATYSLLLIITLTILTTVGWTFTVYDWLPILLGLIGYITFFIHFITWIKEKKQSSIFLIIFSLLIGLWLGMSIWSQGSLTPFIWERILLRSMHPETLFHMTVANMLKNYQVSSTGLDGIPKFHYHYGSHFLFASFSNLLHVDMISFFELAYPIIFLPLLAIAVVFLSRYLQFTIFCSPDISDVQSHWLYWGLFAAGFIGFLPDSLLYKLGIPPLIFFSESYVVAMAFCFFLIIIVVDTVRHTFKKTDTQISFSQVVKYLITILLALFVGLTKVSHLYILLGMGWYAAIRLTKFRKQLVIVMGLTTLGSIFVYKEVILADHSDGIALFHYFLKVISLRWLVLWVVVGMGAVWSYLIFAYNRKRMAVLSTTGQFDIELVLFTAIVGLLPALMLDLGPNGHYFVDTVRWLVFILLLSQADQLLLMFKLLAQKYEKKIFQPVVALCLLLFFAILLASSLNNMFLTFSKFMIQKLQAQTPVPTSARIQVLNELRQLSKNTDHHNSAVYLSKTSPFWQDEPPCSDSGLIATSLSGYALLNGMPESDCNLKRYAYSLYGQHKIELTTNNLEELCQYAQQKSIQKIFVIGTDTNEVSCELNNSK